MSKDRSTPQPRITQRSLFFWILRRQRSLQFFLLCIILASLFFRVFPLEMQKRIINEAINLQQEQLLFLYCGLYFGAVILASISKYAINVMQTIIGQRILIEMRAELYHHILQLPLQFYRKMQPGTVISAMTAELNAIGFFLGGALAIPVTSVLTFAVFLAFMFSLSPLLALLSIAIYPFELVIIPLLQKRYNRINKKRIATTRAMANVINESISGIHEIHANGSYRLEEERLGGFIRSLATYLNKLFIVKYGIKFANNIFQSVGPFILFLVGGYLAINGEFTLGALVAFLSAYEKVYDPWKELLEYYQSLQDAQVHYQQIMNIFDQDIEHPQLPIGREPLILAGAIKLQDAGFAVGSGVKLLDHISMQIRPGEQVALVGYSGSGKSTLALLMAQLYNPSSGSVLLDDKDITKLSKVDINQNITMIAQHPFIFSGTLRDNLLYAVRAINDDDTVLPDRQKIFSILRDVGMEDDILRFGFNSIIPRERVRPLRQKFLRMRQIINTELGKQFSSVIERYDVNVFLYYSSLRDNLIFGDSAEDEYTLNNLPRNREVRKLLLECDLEQKLLSLGHSIATMTVDLLRNLGDDDFFFRGSPMLADEIEMYAQLVKNCGDHLPTKKEEQNKLLELAFRYIPARHKITTLEPGLDQDILKARHVFLRDFVNVDIASCSSAAEQLHKEGNIVALPTYEEQNFTPYCPSEYLYSHTLRDNLLFGAMKKDLREHEQLVELALTAFTREGLKDEILDIGLDFDVGSRGDRLSGGQKQKVAIARSFLKDAPILIMDEATASLDNASQAKIQHILEQQYHGTRTVVSVIHRLDLTPSYDRIFVLKDGSIIEEGTYDELMARKGAFYDLTQAT